MRRAVFLDRDGVVNKSVPRLHTHYGSPRHFNELVLMPGVREAIDLIKEMNFLIVVVTNQPEVARGLLAADELDAMHSYISRALPIDDIFVCPHDDEAGCECRKPKPGMLLVAAEKWDIDLSRSFLVGDRPTDMGAAHAVGAQGILVGPAEFETKDSVMSARDLLEAGHLISDIAGPPNS